MKLYNTLSKKIEEVVPIADKKINMFVCGPTVYDLSHIGHAKTYIQMDILARTLRAQGFEIFYLQNITDIDDKIIQRAQDAKNEWTTVSLEFEKEYYKDMESLNNTAVDKYAKATDHIDDIKRQVQAMLDKKLAYVVEYDGVYFEIEKFPEYGKLSGRSEIKENDAQSRIDQSDQKRGWNDFCLWKFSKPGEPVWDAGFGKGRPGWHIEDTAITEHYFGPQYDIHGGAIDLIFPHHEAEITQMESISGKVPLVRHWVHSGFLNIGGSRMGKSKGNFITVREIMDKGYQPMAIRLMMMQSHYRSSIDFSWDILESAQNSYKKILSWADLRFQGFKSDSLKGVYATALKSFENSMQDDLMTPEALAILSGMVKKIEDEAFAPDSQVIEAAVQIIENYLGLGLLNQSDISGEAKKLIKEREEARKGKDWEHSDNLRDKLLKQGIKVKDTDYGSVWSRA